MRISDWSSDVCSSDLFRVAVFLVLGKAAGAVKEMAVAYRYGISDAVDAYQFTMTMANWLPVTIVGVLGVVLIPVLVRLRRAGGHERGLFVRELRSEEHKSELQSLKRNSYPVICLNKKT